MPRPCTPLPPFSFTFHPNQPPPALRITPASQIPHPSPPHANRILSRERGKGFEIIPAPQLPPPTGFLALAFPFTPSPSPTPLRPCPPPILRNRSETWPLIPLLLPLGYNPLPGDRVPIKVAVFVVVSPFEELEQRGAKSGVHSDRFAWIIRANAVRRQGLFKESLVEGATAVKVVGRSHPSRKSAAFTPRIMPRT